MRFDDHQRERTQSPVIELTNELPFNHGVAFNASALTIRGVYGDELSAYRAKRVWAQTLSVTFLLEDGVDFDLWVSEAQERFLLTCQFTSACARYAFWRLTNDQAPEAQYLLETGHIPDCEARFEEFVHAPDMVEEQQLFQRITEQAEQNEQRLRRWIRALLAQLGRT